jgi:hypothetical protein
MPNATYKRWSTEDIAKLNDMAQKIPFTEIASQLGRTPGATVVQAHKMKISLRCLGRKRRRLPSNETQPARRINLPD